MQPLSAPSQILDAQRLLQQCELKEPRALAHELTSLLEFVRHQPDHWLSRSVVLVLSSKCSTQSDQQKKIYSHRENDS